MAILHNREETTLPCPPHADDAEKVSLAHLGTVSETLVIPLWGVASNRAEATAFFTIPRQNALLTN